MAQLCVMVVLLLTSFESTEAATNEAWYEADYDSLLTTTNPPLQDGGCALKPNFEFFDWEPKKNPLLIHVNLKILHMRDIPNSGGSFGMDIG